MMGKINNKLKLGHYRTKEKKSTKTFIYPLIIGLILLGAVYQIYSVYAHASEYGRIGKLIDVNGHAMHLYTSGSSDIPLVFSSNIGTSTPYADMYPLISNLSSEANAAVYDKPGYGWSDMTKAPRDIDIIASEIHTLLQNANYPLPFIWVAHSMGSLEALRYAQLYPDEVAGIVLIDGASPEFCSEFNNIMVVESFITNALRNIGLLRFFKDTESFQNTLNPNASLPQELKNMNEGITLEKAWNRNMLEEKLKLQSNAKVILEGGNLGDIPLRIITSKSNPYGTWQKTQTKMLDLSSNSSQAFIEGSVNFIEDHDIKTILSVIEELKLSLQPEEE
ncbi:MAG: alpha/beta hydrolase [Clostridia bacterium]|nr:alpha/beta hydrolase [Clostridia bacterium]